MTSFNLFSTNKDDYLLLQNDIKKVYKRIPIDFGGGCSLIKGLTIAGFIKEFNLATSADIGVYRGRSFFPQAIAHTMFTKGIVYGIDPFDSDAAVQNDNEALQNLLSSFIQNTNFEDIYIKVKKLIRKFKLDNHTQLIREKSEDAKIILCNNNIKLGLIHIDGNHDTRFVIKDLNDYLPLLQDEGIVVMDDISWGSVKPALSLLDHSCQFIGKLTNAENDFGIYINSNSVKKVEEAKNIFAKIVKM